ncbi:MAG TPA: Druantia anti-phage system protein DruA [Desulfobacterales bacterium]|nr:Druantia anti-phage system protein DruA [Desulfobacterales bacterium]
MTYRKRSVSMQDIATIRKIIESHPDKSRRFISQEVCRTWNWRQPNGVLKDMVCRSLLLLLESKGYIKLPARKFTPHNPLAKRKKPCRVEVDQTPIQCSVSGLFPIKLEQVRKTTFEKLFNGLISDHHYLGYTQPVGEHLKYVAFAAERPIACLAWGSSPWYIGARDRFIGWSRKSRENNLHLIANNLRFLIPPWIEVPCLASYLLALNRHRLSKDWRHLYHHPIHLVETFVDTEKYRGTCYKADNWIRVGKTTGLGKLSKSRRPLHSKKDVYIHPLTRHFRRELCA